MQHGIALSLSKFVSTVELHERRGKPIRPQKEIATSGSHGVIDQAHSSAQVFLVVELRFHCVTVDERAQVGGEIPAHRVVVHVHFTKASQGLNLVVLTLILCAVFLFHRPCNERKAVGDLGR